MRRDRDRFEFSPRAGRPQRDEAAQRLTPALARGIAVAAAILGVVAARSVQAATYDLLVKGGQLIDPKNGVDGRLDVAVAAGKVVAIGADLPEAEATTVVRANGLFVVPGLVDMHAHVFHGTEPDRAYSNGPGALPPDGFTFRSGVTTVVDAGGSGWRNFLTFKRQVIDTARTRVLAFLNIVGEGMAGDPLEQDAADMDPRLCSMRIVQHPKLIVGIKSAHFRGGEWTSVDRAVQAGRMAKVPVMVDFGEFTPARPYRDLVLRHLRAGDISTHLYTPPAPLLDAKGVIAPFLNEARKRGVLFDVGHGGGSFAFRQAVPVTKQGFWPDTISSDLHAGSMNGGMKDLTNVMSKFLALGMPVKDVIARVTAHPARVIQRPELGQLAVGSEADITILAIRQGEFGFVDVEGGRLAGTQKIECEATIRAGRVVWDLNGISRQDWTKTPARALNVNQWPPPTTPVGKW